MTDKSFDALLRERMASHAELDTARISGIVADRKHRKTKARSERKKRDPLAREKQRTIQKRYYDRHAHTPEGSAAIAAKNHRYYVRHKDDPEYQERKREERERRKAMPDYAEKHREYQREYRRRMRKALGDEEYRRRRTEEKRKYMEKRKTQCAK